MMVGNRKIWAEGMHLRPLRFENEVRRCSFGVFDSARLKGPKAMDQSAVLTTWLLKAVLEAK
jgi:hypothetical protein